jgi:hypothetical protein
VARELYLDVWLGARYLIAENLNGISVTLFIALSNVFLLFLLSALTRRRWLAASIFVLIFVVSQLLVRSDPMITGPFELLFNAMTIIIVLRFGLATLATAVFVNGLFDLPITTDFSAWYSGSVLAVLLVVLAIAGYAFHTSLGGQQVFAGKLLEE